MAREGTEEGNYQYYTQDEQKSTMYLLDEQQEIKNTYRYDAFGNLLEKEEESINRLLYTGQIYDEAMGQYYLRVRYYSPVIGRFLQEDVYRGDGLNLYVYCGNHPVRYYDPSGYLKICSEPGNWEITNESMSDASRNYQKFVTGAEDGMVYKVNGVKFDGYKDGTLMEVKGDYSNFVNKNSGEFYGWFKGKDSLTSQANRQLIAANGTKIQWYFNDEISMNAVKELFLNENIKGLDFILKPMK